MELENIFSLETPTSKSSDNKYISWSNYENIKGKMEHCLDSEVEKQQKGE